MRNHWTKKQCDSVIAANKDNTAFFGNNIGIVVEGNSDYKEGCMTYEAMYNMLCYRMGFGESETQVIIASLIKAGAMFVD